MRCKTVAGLAPGLLVLVSAAGWTCRSPAEFPDPPKAEILTIAEATDQPTFSPAAVAATLATTNRGPLGDRTPPREAVAEIIVKYRQAAEFAPRRLLTGRLWLAAVRTVTSGDEVVYRFPRGAFTGLTVGESAARVLAILQAVRTRADVQYAQPNYIQRAFTRVPRDSLYGRQWSLGAISSGGINLPAAWERGTGNRSVVVAVLDSGILPDHPDVMRSPNLLPGYDMISVPELEGDGDGRDPLATDIGDGSGEEIGHGTHVAGIVGVGKSDNREGVAGINWSVGVVPVRVLGGSRGATTDINDAIRWAAGLEVPGVPPNRHPARIINLSFGTDEPCSASPATQSAIDAAVAAKALVVVAAGNGDDDVSGTFPASCHNVITVAASDALGRLAPYSNHGKGVTILAPGGHVGRDLDGDGVDDGILGLSRGDRYEFLHGTSLAAPHVAGVLALWLSWADTTNAALIDELRRSASPRTSEQCPFTCGAGLLNAVPFAFTSSAGRSTP